MTRPSRYHVPSAGSYLALEPAQAVYYLRMGTLSNLSVAMVALLHGSFLIAEMFLWDKPLGLRLFGHTSEAASVSKILAANQGLYNGFLMVGLIWGLSLGDAGRSIKIFFLSCVVVAGVFGAATASSRILWIQALPGAIAMALVLYHTK